jgi:hypothetical protein
VADDLGAWRSEIRGDEVCDHGLRVGIELADGILNAPIGVGDALVLSEMLEPGRQHERFHKPSGPRRVLEDVP